MLDIRPTGDVLGATVTGIDLSRPMSEPDFAGILRALGAHGVLRFPEQLLQPAALRDFSARFGSIQYSVTGKFQDPEVPEVGTLSNIVIDGKPIGIADAGQDWHTDMSYRDTMGFVNVLNAHKVPMRDGRPLGNTQFANMHAAYEALDPALQRKLEGMTATHDFNKFWEGMLAKGSGRGALTPAQRASRPPSIHPIFLTHPITGRRVLYCNPGYAVRINELDEAESARMLDLLFAHQLEDRFIYNHVWAERDLLIWDNIGTLHNALPDYRADEPRLMKRCQVMADRVFQPGFVPQAALAAAE
ncbi:TauD/TfdA dioxygenase family protein [Falsiroseomonas selenitidurans]|uniref:TauD/TfdA family dioxygenase n=1 Tax=Falsiroseomonas selenitidurans TaxID=2716335 RepID=A0ABX1E755_9PROT|nr:TauD/TfdA family dioxygenase [Falsiroseomonas selenitidurans]NKC30760.1 TauD/TfdA family dioxygenase [Falsiroseomonas selenitidurans]